MSRPAIPFSYLLSLILLSAAALTEVRGLPPTGTSLHAESIRWVETLDQALAEAAEKNQFVVLYLFADWSPACRALESEVYSEPTTIAFARQTVFVKADAEKSGPGRRLKEKYGVEVFPTLLVLSAAGDEIGRHQGFLSSEELVADLRGLMTDKAAFGRLLKRDKSEKLSPADLLRLAGEYYRRRDYRECARRIEQMASFPQDESPGLDADYLFLSASVYHRLNRYEESAAAARQFAARYAKDLRIDEIFFIEARDYLALKHYARAGDLLAGRLEKSPDIPTRKRIRRLLSRIPLQGVVSKQGYRAVLKESAERLEKGEYGDAISLNKQALQAAPFIADTHLQMSRIYLRQAAATGNPIERNRLNELGREELRIARTVEPDHYQAYREEKRILAPRLPPRAPIPADQEMDFHAILKALSDDPADPQVWEALSELGRAANFPLVRHENLIPYELLALSKDVSSQHPRNYIRVRAQTVPAWKEYARIRQLWRKEKFGKAHPSETMYRLTAAEELEALETTVKRWRQMKSRDSKLNDEALDFLDAVETSHMLEAYIFLENFSQEMRAEYEAWKNNHPSGVRQYLIRWLFHPPEGLRSLTSAERLATDRSGSQGADMGLQGSMITRRRAFEYFNRAIAAHRKRDWENAITLYNQTLEVEPNFAPAHQNLALIYFNRGNLLQAALHGERGLLQIPGNASLVYLATQAYNQLQLFDDASRILRAAINSPIQPKQRAGLLDRLAYIHILKLEWNKAGEYLKEAQSLDSGNTQIKQHLELLKMQRGKTATKQPAQPR